jgi:hypothetical protein
MDQNRILYLAAQDVERAGVDMKRIIDALETVYRQKGQGDVEMPPKIGVRSTGTVGMKWIGAYPANFRFNVPQISGLIILNNEQTGLPYCIMDCRWIKEGKYALNWTRLSCHDFDDNQVRLQLFALAYNLGNFLRRLVLPKSVKKWSLRTLREKLIKIGAKVVNHSRYVIFQMAEVTVPRILFREILDRIRRLRFLTIPARPG